MRKSGLLFLLLMHLIDILLQLRLLFPYFADIEVSFYQHWKMVFKRQIFSHLLTTIQLSHTLFLG